MTSPDDGEIAPSALTGMTRSARLALKRELAAKCAELGIPVNDTTSPGQLALKHDTSQVQRPHLEAIDDVLIKLLAEPNRRQMIFVPPQTGKSTRTSRWFPFWWLTMRPKDRIILASYAASLAQTHGAATRDLVLMYGEEYGLRLKDAENTKAAWAVRTGGGMRATGVRGGLTGQPMDCLSGDTVIFTHVGPRKIGEIVESGDYPHVLSYNHTHDRAEWRPVIATRTIHGRPLVRITTAAGRTIDCTADHRIRTARGYVAATDLVAGDRLTTSGDTDLRPMRHTGYAAAQVGRAVHPRPRGGDLLQHSVSGSADPVHVHLQVLQDRVHPPAVRGAEDEAVGATRSAVLLTAMPPQAHADPEGTQVPALRNTDPERGLSPLLLGRVPDDRTVSEPTQGPHPSGRDNHLSRVSGRVPSEDQPPCLLQSDVREPGAQPPDGRHGQLPVHDRTQLRELVPQHAATHPGTREPTLHAVRGDTAAGHVPASRETSDPVSNGGASHQRGPVGQQGGEPGGAVQHLPRPTPPRSADTVVSVRELHGESHTVYDLQVEGNSNFFANEVLVHNCGIIDDPVKDREQAESPIVRASVWDWYSSVWSTRKAPDFREVLIMTRFHKDDLAGRLLDQDGRVEEGGAWHVLHLPTIALAEDRAKGIYADPLGREPGDPITHPRIDPADTGGLIAHWARTRKTVTNRDWNALYQGTPFDAEGALLTADDVRAHTATPPDAWRRNVVGVDPSGGGRDTAGIVVVGLDRDGKGWFRADYTARMSSYEWPKQACMAAYEFDAGHIVVETNFGGDQATTLIAQAWDELQRKNQIPADRLCPLLKSVTAKKSKILRAEPIAQAIKTDRLWFSSEGGLKQLEDEWLLWEPGTTWSPGALDAGVYGATEVLPPISRGAGVANPVGRSRGSAPRTGVASRRIAG
ncbi:terminase [Gordonia phage Clown]|uniref:Terminase n=1 Tax=Gordonia phage Clown TaxID=2759393 RepID=A0A7L7SHU2_9CAUD|nr:terminase large subunit [Gordonia phage Clown]QOC56003.1 terminase [Gordonia phage Clown]